MKKKLFPSHIYQFAILLCVVCGMLTSQLFIYSIQSGSILYVSRTISIGPYAVSSLWMHFYLLFMIGAYVGASSVWIVLYEKKIFKPFLIAGGAVAGLSVGYLLSVKLFPLSNISAQLNIFQRLIIFLSALLGGNIAALVRSSKPATRTGIIISFLTGLLVLIAPLVLTWEKVDETLPSANVSAPASGGEAIRQTHQFALKYIEANTIIATVLGGPLEVKAQGKAVLRMQSDELVGGELSYHVTGMDDQGSVTIFYLQKEQGRWVFTGVFEHSGQEYQLDEIIYRELVVQ